MCRTKTIPYPKQKTDNVRIEFKCAPSCYRSHTFDGNYVRSRDSSEAKTEILKQWLNDQVVTYTRRCDLSSSSKKRVSFILFSDLVVNLFGNLILKNKWWRDFCSSEDLISSLLFVCPKMFIIHFSLSQSWFTVQWNRLIVTLSYEFWPWTFRP